jgi:hypothetical protein
MTTRAHLRDGVDELLIRDAELIRARKTRLCVLIARLILVRVAQALTETEKNTAPITKPTENLEIRSLQHVPRCRFRARTEDTRLRACVRH